MTILDEMAESYLAEFEAPPGPDATEIVARGRHRRRRKAVATVAALVGVAALSVSLWPSARSNPVVRTSDRPTVETPPVDESSAGEERAATTSDADGPRIIDMNDDFGRFPDAEPLDLPLQLAPIEAELPQGWGVTMVEAAASGAEWHTAYLLIAEQEQIGVRVNPGQVSLDDEHSVTLRRGGRNLPANTIQGSDLSTILQWNEIPRVNDGAVISISGDVDLDRLTEIAELLPLENQPITGATEPNTRELTDDMDVLFAGTVDGHQWRVLVEADAAQLSDQTRSPGAVAIEMDGVAPYISVTSGREGRVDVDMQAITFDGTRLVALIAPADATEIAAIHGDLDPVVMPRRQIPGTDLVVAVAAIPARSISPVIVVTGSDGRRTLLSIQIALGTGWTGSHQRIYG